MGLARGDSAALSRAAELFAGILEIHPELVEAHHNLGAAYLGLGRLEPAEEQFRAALALAPDHDLARKGLAIAQQRLRKSR